MGTKPQILKIQAHVERIETELRGLDPIPYGGSNPYNKCAACGRSMIEASYAGHFSNCKYEKLERILNKLKKSHRHELKQFLKKQKFNQDSFINYVFLKKDEHVSGLQELVGEVKKYLKSNNITDSNFNFRVSS